MRRPSLLVVNQYYEPDLASTGRYAAGLCSGLVDRGWRVRVVCGQPSYSRARSELAPAHELRAGVEVHRLSLFGVAGRDSIARRFLGYGIFMAKALHVANRLARVERPNVVLTFHNPPFIGLVGRELSRRHDISFVYSPFDILPDVLRVGGWNLPKLAFRLWDRTNCAIHSSAAAIVVLHSSMRDVMERKGVDPDKIKVAHLWAVPDLLEEASCTEVRREFCNDEEGLLVVYAGNMGYMHSVDRILKAAEAVRDQPIYFVLIGEGPRKASLEEQRRRRKLERVTILGYQSEERFREIVSSADAAFVTLMSGAEELGAPSRALTFLSAGTPIIALSPPTGSLADLVQTSGAGWLVRDEYEISQLLKVLLDTLDCREERTRRCRELYRTEWTREAAVKTYDTLLRGTLDPVASLSPSM